MIERCGIYRYNTDLKRIEYWGKNLEMWIVSIYTTLEFISPDFIVLYKNSWAEPCEGITE